MQAGNFKISMEDGRTSFLNAAKVQIGTAELGSRDASLDGSVAKYRIRFACPFESRPVILVSTVPGTAEGAWSLGVHQVWSRCHFL